MSTYQPSDAEWNVYGTMFAASRFGSRMLGAALWGVQAFMTLDGLSTYLNIPRERRKGHLRFVLFSSMMLAATSITMILDIWGVFDGLFKAGPTGRSYIEAFRKDAEPQSSSRKVKIIGGVMADAAIAAGDILMLWRCSIMWRSKRWVIIFPSVTCTGSIAARVVGLILMSAGTFLVHGAPALAYIIAESFSVSTKVMVTGLILFQLTKTRLTISKSCPNLKRPPAYSNVAAIVIESAAPVALFGPCYIIVTAITYYRKPELLMRRGMLNALSEVFSSLYFSFSVLSPQMVIFRVLNGRSWKNAQESNELTEKLSTTLRFATHDSTSTDDIEAEGTQSSVLGIDDVKPPPPIVECNSKTGLIQPIRSP